MSNNDSEATQEAETNSRFVLHAHKLTKVYKTGEVEVKALDGVDFEVFEHEMVVLLGQSGSGKSTLLNILGGLDVASSGEVYFKDKILDSSNKGMLTNFRREHVGFVFQFYNLIPSLTAVENVALVTEIAENPMQPEEALDLVGLLPRKDHFPAQLSGGEQQRVAIARAIAKQPEILLCDEPTGALDHETGILVLEAIEQVNRELGTATVVITHNTSVGGIADRVVTLRDGKISDIHKNLNRISPAELKW
ncbi:ABC transporter ATP-binding protein [Kangiella sediminilitoris]|uniref:ABC transporter n=1 Tax=Kangiella sediminilitoris TaxID=1144748 RepID=A0A1B3BAU3_9GAMM|nr:ABC transporter ATP-binding protein [Kangiella sediminilitoris]AOE49923.1 ABC transporter [Kangiella sediminilitoris]